MARSIAVVVVVAVAVLALWSGVAFVSADPSPCDVSVSNQVLASGSMLTYSCPSQTTKSMTGYRVSSDQPYSVLFTDGGDCTSGSPTTYPLWSVLNVNSSVTTTRIVSANAAPSWSAGPCFRIRNDGAVATAALSITIQWFTIEYANQFHLVNTGQYFGVGSQDVSISSVWTDSNLTGNGVVIDICDDGLQIAHSELAAGARLDLSYNYETSVMNPTGGLTDTHGTACGGVAAADGANAICGRGAAYRAQVAGHRILGFAGATSAHYADAMYNQAIATDVSSNSWGPPGCGASGCTFYPTEAVIQTAIESGAVRGRLIASSGVRLGRPYVFAAGNEGLFGGDSNQYAYTKLKEVMTIAGSGYDGKRVVYSNTGANLFLNGKMHSQQRTAPRITCVHPTPPSNRCCWHVTLCVAPTQGQSSGSGPTSNVPGIITAQGGAASNACRDDFGGTSSATPLVAGVIAVLLEARPTLNNRDIQYLLRSTATKNDPTSGTWFQNGAGVWYSRYYGFGRVNTVAALNALRATTYAAPAAQSVVTGAAVTLMTSTVVVGDQPAINSTFAFAGGSGSVVYIENVVVCAGWC